MTEKIVFQTDFDGVYVGPMVADESPLEPGVFLLPAGCVEVEPPVLAENQRARWLGAEWLVETRVELAHEPELSAEPEADPEPGERQYVDAIQRHMDNAAQTFGYDSVQTVVTYAEEPAWPKFQLEGQGFRAWRSLVWAYVYEQLALVQNGEREQPTIADFILELPELVIPAPEPIQEPVAEEPAPTDTTNEGTPV